MTVNLNSRHTDVNTLTKKWQYNIRNSEQQQQITIFYEVNRQWRFGHRARVWLQFPTLPTRFESQHQTYSDPELVVKVEQATTFENNFVMKQFWNLQRIVGQLQ